jgi:hypothetical protein
MFSAGSCDSETPSEGTDSQMKLENDIIYILADLLLQIFHDWAAFHYIYLKSLISVPS